MAGCGDLSLVLCGRAGHATLCLVSCRHALAVALVAAWLSPAAMATAVGFHVAAHDHGRAHERQHVVVLDELREALAHGHAHEIGVPEHDHRAAPEPPTSLRVDTAVSAAPPVATAPMGPVAQWAAGHAPDRPPPVPLFTLHCALLS